MISDEDLKRQKKRKKNETRQVDYAADPVARDARNIARQVGYAADPRNIARQVGYTADPVARDARNIARQADYASMFLASLATGSAV